MTMFARGSVFPDILPVPMTEKRNRMAKRMIKRFM